MNEPIEIRINTRGENGVKQPLDLATAKALADAGKAIYDAISGSLIVPSCDGWWDWIEGGNGNPERVLIVGGGSHVANDDEWESAMDRPPDLVFCENYWEGTETTQAMMPGLWRYVGERPK